MKNCYLSRDPDSVIGSCIIDLVPSRDILPYPGFVITRVSTTPNSRRKGLARALIQEVLRDADAEGHYLFLEVLSSGDMSRKDLTRWYRSLGFTLSRFGYMIRPPEKI